jgi:hypothetical protein
MIFADGIRHMLLKRAYAPCVALMNAAASWSGFQPVPAILTMARLGLSVITEQYLDNSAS